MRNISIKEASYIMVKEGIGEEAPTKSVSTDGTQVHPAWMLGDGSLMEVITTFNPKKVSINLYEPIEV